MAAYNPKGVSLLTVKDCSFLQLTEVFGTVILEESARYTTYVFLCTYIIIN